MASAVGGRRSAEVAERTRHAILVAAAALFTERGFDSVSLRDIADRAGTTHGLIRHHFGAKDRVWSAVLDHADAHWGEQVLPAVEAADDIDDPVEALRVVVRAIVRVSAEQPHLSRLLFAEGVRGGPRLDQIMERTASTRKALETLSDRLRGAGWNEALPAGEFVMSVLLLSVGRFALAGLAGSLGGGADDPDHHADRVIDLLLG